MEEVKFAVVLPTYVQNEERRGLAVAAFQSLAKTCQPSRRPNLLLVEKHTAFSVFDVGLFNVFSDVWRVQQPGEIGGTEQTLAWGTQDILDNEPSVEFIVWLGDDALFHPDWLRQLEALIGRHPEARAWSVYHSAHQAYHRDLELVPYGDLLLANDVRVQSICGHGMTFSRWEWMEWGIDWRQGQRWPVPSGGNTLDLHHAYHRPGERWVTAKSFVEHTGRVGTNVAPGVPEWAVDFQGIGE